jgi:hypothetical protein
MLFTLEEYFAGYPNHPDITKEVKGNATKLITACTALSASVKLAGIQFKINPGTGTVLSGVKNGGFRPQSCTVGTPKSSHKQGLAVDIFDPHEDIDNWCMKHQNELQKYGIYMEDPKHTPHWSHWTIKSPASGKRVFIP